MLDDCSISHGKRREKETHGDSGDWPEWDANFSEERVYEAVEDRDEDDDNDRVLCFVSVLRLWYHSYLTVGESTGRQ